MTLDKIKQVLVQILDDGSTDKPDLFCSEIVFLRLQGRSDCKGHPVRKDTLVMSPNIYWTIDKNMQSADIRPNTSKGRFVLQYLQLVSYYITMEHGEITLINNFIIEERKKREAHFDNEQPPSFFEKDEE